MKAILHRRFDPPEELQLEEIPRPEPAAGEVVVRVRSRVTRSVLVVK